MRDLYEFKRISNLMVSNRNAAWCVYRISNNSPVQLMEDIAVLDRALEKKSRMKLLPSQPGDLLDTYTDTNDWINEFLYEPVTSLAIGVEKSVDWFINH